METVSWWSNSPMSCGRSSADLIQDMNKPFHIGCGKYTADVSALILAGHKMAKEHAEAALLTLAEIATGDGAASARVSAATAILDRAYGKPTQALEHSATSDPLKQLLQEVSGSAFRPVERY